VTLRQLLQHTSGVPNYTKSPAWQAQAATDPQATVTPELLLGLVANEPLGFTPGPRYEYSNSDNLIIGLMAEAVTGRAYEELLQELVYSPLGLKRTSLPSVVEMPRPYVRGYDVAPPDPPVGHHRGYQPLTGVGVGGEWSPPPQI
jgi:D-alanyl-D-alanine carboxypeptidase